MTDNINHDKFMGLLGTNKQLVNEVAWHKAYKNDFIGKNCKLANHKEARHSAKNDAQLRNYSSIQDKNQKQSAVFGI